MLYPTFADDNVTISLKLKVHIDRLYLDATICFIVAISVALTATERKEERTIVYLAKKPHTHTKHKRTIQCNIQTGAVPIL